MSNTTAPQTSPHAPTAHTPPTRTQNPFSQAQGPESLADLSSKPPTRDPEPSTRLHVAADGKLPGAGDEVRRGEVMGKEVTGNERKPGGEDEAGNKILHQGGLGRVKHWEHGGMNADV